MIQSISILQSEVYEEVSKASDYVGSKMLGDDSGARERILATDAVLDDLTRFWDESILVVNENFKDILHSFTEEVDNGDKKLSFSFEVSLSFDTNLLPNVEKAIKNFFILSIIAQWFKYTNKGESQDYFNQSAEMITAAERLLYSRKKPVAPTR